MVAPGQHLLEEVEVVPHCPAESLHPAHVALPLWLLELLGDLVRRPLPDPVEPVDEEEAIGPAAGVLRVERRRVGEVLLEVEDDLHRVDHHALAVDQDRHQVLPADPSNFGSIARRDGDRFRSELLVGERQGDPLDVGRVLDPVELEHLSPP